MEVQEPGVLMSGSRREKGFSVSLLFCSSRPTSIDSDHTHGCFWSSLLSQLIQCYLLLETCSHQKIVFYHLSGPPSAQSIWHIRLTVTTGNKYCFYVNQTRRIVSTLHVWKEMKSLHEINKCQTFYCMDLLPGLGAWFKRMWKLYLELFFSSYLFSFKSKYLSPFADLWLSATNLILLSTDTN